MLPDLPSHKHLTFDFAEYPFHCPVGLWRARLVMKAWGKNRNILLYFREVGTERGYCLTVFDPTLYAPRDGSINFRRTGEIGQLFELETGKTRGGRTSFLSAAIVAASAPVETLRTPSS